MPRRTGRLLATALLLGTALGARAQPTVLARTPVRNALSAARTTNVALTFSQNINPVSVGGIRVFSAQRGGWKAGAFATGGPVVSFNPATDFRPGEKVSVTVPSTVLSTPGNQGAAKHVYQFTAAVTNGFASFAPATNAVMNAKNIAVALADIDSDGDLDLLAGTPYDSTVVVRRNTGTGSFGAGVVYNVGRRQIGEIVMADVDSDHDLDLVTVNSYTGNVSVLRNNGTGAFGAPAVFDAGNGGTERLQAGDLDGDGDLDLATFGSPSGQVQILLNDGTGAYTMGATLTVGTNGFGAGDLELGDLNNDGDLDIVVADFQNGTIETFANTGNATFGARVDKVLGSNPEALALLDVEGDGDLDVVSDGYLLRNNGSGTLSAPVASSGAEYSLKSVVGDLDGDGDLDIVNAALSNVRISLNDGAGGFTDGRYIPGNGSFGVAVGDLDGDGDLDIVSTDRDTSMVSVFINSFQVVDALPQLNTLEAPVNTNLALAFSGLVKASTAGNLRVFGTRSRGKRAGSATVVADTLKFNPALDFMPGELVQISVPPTVQSSTSVGARPYVGQFVATATGGSGWFGGTLRVTVGSGGPQGTTLADVNEDGRLDALTTVLNDNKVAVLLGDGAGGLTATASVATGAFPSNMAVGDFNADGHLDMVVTNQNGGTLTVRMGTGTGTFGGGSTLTTGASPLGIAVGDVDGDGDLDIVSGATGALRRFANNGAGTFGAPLVIPITDGGGQVVLGDIDSDGDLDILTPDAFNDVVRVLRNSGTGTFTEQAPVPAGDAPFRIALADINNNGTLDLAVLNNFSQSLVTYTGDGHGTFSVEATISNLGTVRGMTAGDVDGDKDVDFVITNTAVAQVVYRTSNGLVMGPTVNIGGVACFYSALGDMDQDGDLDLVSSIFTNEVSVRLNEDRFVVTARAPERLTATAPVASDVVVTLSAPVKPTTASRLRVYGTQRDGRKSGVFSGVGQTITLEPLHDFAAGEVVNVVVSDGVESITGQPVKPYAYQFRAAATGGTATFTAPAVPNVPTAGQPWAVATGDVDGDGFLDAVVADITGNNLNVHRGDGTGAFGPATVLAEGTTLTDVKLGDVDHDGDLDLVTARSPATTLGVRLNNGSGVFGAATSVPATYAAWAIELGDLNGDGNLDIVSANRNDDRVMLLSGNGNGTFGNEDVILFSAGMSPVSATLADIDNDGDIDVLIPNQSQDKMFLMRNINGSLHFGGSLTTAAGPIRTIAADFDGDGDVDLATLCTGSNKVSLHFNDLAFKPGFVKYTAGATLTVGQNPTDMATADLDGDGDLDLLTSSRTSDNVSIRLNNGNGTFGSVAAPGVGDEPQALAVGDVDNDGDVDLLAANRNAASFSVRLNGGVASPAPVVATFVPDHGVTGTVVTLTGTNFTGATSVTFDGVAAPGFVVNGGGTQITVSSPANTFNGPITVTTPNGVSSTATDFGVDLVISAAETIPAGDFHHITVTATGAATLGGDVEATAPVLVQAGGELATGTSVLSGAGDFTLEPAATLAVGHPQGLNAAGALQLTGTVVLPVGADYTYNGTNAQVTGTRLPAEVRNLTIDNPAGVSLTQAASVRQVLTMANDGDLLVSDFALTLLSDAEGTALVHNAGHGIVDGVATAQCWLNPATNAGLGYRHLSAPTKTSTVADLATKGLELVLNPAYNAVPGYPVNVQPFPTVFGFDETRFPASAIFEKGYYSPTALAEALEVGRGYAVYISGGATPDFNGQLITGDVTKPSLTRTGSFAGNAQKSGWHLLGNPYPSPIDWDLVAVPAGLNPSISVFRSTGAGNTGVYLTRANGLGSLPDGIVPLGQAFFARVETAPVDLTFTNACRVTTFGSPAHYRTAPDARPAVSLTLRAAGTEQLDGATVYFQDGATDRLDRDFDGERPAHNVGLPTLVSLTPAGQELAVNGLPETALRQPTRVPLLLDLPTAGTYELTVARCANLPAGVSAVLEDAVTGTRYELTGATCRFTTTLGGMVPGRFALVFNGRSNATAAANVLTLYPNPAHGQVRVLGVAAGEVVRVLDGVGREVLTVTAQGDDTLLPLTALPAGVYVVKAGGRTQRLVVE